MPRLISKRKSQNWLNNARKAPPSFFFAFPAFSKPAKLWNQRRKHMAVYGIDISEHNGEIDLSEYKDQFVIIRAGWGWSIDQKDRQFEDRKSVV